MANSKIYLADKIDNTQRKFGSAKEYIPVKVYNKDGDMMWAMFTEDVIEYAIQRALKNREDIPKTLWDSIFK